MVARLLVFTAVEEGNVLEIIRTSTAHDLVAFALSGEITLDQIPRLQALVDAARSRGEVVTIDLEHVWRVDRDAAFLIARHVRKPDNGVRVSGLSTGLVEWLSAVADERP